mmetsp:Transcript_11897/g.14811  ORF Transcript_11897/g.14811 Transcript_11897/m.14811 type:complete len:229 (+) Transcript_11897:160-846(+)
MLSSVFRASRSSASSSLRNNGTRAFSSQTFTLPDLAYDYAELEPSISATIMNIHHTKHHQTYITNLNTSLEKYADAEAKGDIAAMIALQSAIKFNGGGHVNHTLFWENLAPNGKGGGENPTGDLANAINGKWGSFDAFKSEFNATTAGVQGSGWGWLAYDPKAKDICIVTCGNQDPCSTTGTVPLLGIDVWEHAYYLDYKNVRPDYLNAIYDVLNWNVAGKRYAKAKA